MGQWHAQILISDPDKVSMPSCADLYQNTTVPDKVSMHRPLSNTLTSEHSCNSYRAAVSFSRTVKMADLGELIFSESEELSSEENAEGKENKLIFSR